MSTISLALLWWFSSLSPNYNCTQLFITRFPVTFVGGHLKNKFIETHATILEVDEIAGTVKTTIKEETYDLIVDARGFANSKLFETNTIVSPKFSAVNSVIIWPEKKTLCRVLYNCTNSQQRLDVWGSFNY